MAKRLVLPTSYHKVADLNHNGGEILPELNRHCNAQNCFIKQEFRGRHHRSCLGKSHRSHNQNVVIKYVYFILSSP